MLRVQWFAGLAYQRTFFSFIRLAESLIHTATAALVAPLGRSASVLGAVSGIMLRSSQIHTLQALPGSQAALAASTHAESWRLVLQCMSTTALLRDFTVQLFCPAVTAMGLAKTSAAVARASDFKDAFMARFFQKR